MGNKQLKPISIKDKDKENPFSQRQNSEDQKKLNRILRNYIFPNKNINENKENKEKIFKPSKISEKNFIDISSLIANQINIKALTKDLSLNFEKSLVLNSHTIQLCPMDNKSDNIIFENKTAILQMNSYDNKFNQLFSNNFLKKEIVNFAKRQKTKKEEFEFGLEMDKEIEILKKSNKKFIL
jgi:hypothetical protein